MYHTPPPANPKPGIPPGRLLLMLLSTLGGVVLYYGLGVFGLSPIARFVLATVLGFMGLAIIAWVQRRTPRS